MHRSIFVAASLMGLALVGCAGQQSARPLSPESVASEVAGGDLQNVRGAWYRLGLERPGVKPTAFRTAGRPAGYAAGPFSADVLRMELDGVNGGIAGGSDALVRIGDAAAWDWQFLAFLNSPSGWRFAGALDLPENRIGAPVPETRTLGPGLAWLIVPVYKQAGASVSEREAAWHQVRDGRLVEVLRTPMEGSRGGLSAPFGASYRAEVLDVFLTPENRPAVTVNIEATYRNARRDAFPGLNDLFKRAGVARYVQDQATGRFVLEEGASDWSRAELAGLLTESADQFVHNNRVQLVELAQSPNDLARQWVSRLRHDCASEEVRHELGTLVTAEPQ